MEAFLIVLFVGTIVLLPIILSIVAIVKASRARRLQAEIDNLSDSLLVTQRAVAKLHNLLRDIEGRGLIPSDRAVLTSDRIADKRAAAPAAYEVAAPDAAADAATADAPTMSEPTAEAPVPTTEPAIQPEPPSETVPALEAEPAVPSQAAPEVQASSEPEPETIADTTEQPPEAASEPTPEPPPVDEPPEPVTEPEAAAEPEVAEPEEPEEAPPPPDGTLEERFVRNVLPKIAVTLIAIAVVYFLGLAIVEMGALGKVLVGYGIGAALLGLGFFAERKESYRTIGRAVLAGAWGVIYFVTFAMHFIPPARIIDSELVGIVALLIAAAGAVVFSLRYNSEWTTLFAFLLIYLTLALSAWRTDANFNLISTTIIAAGLAFLVWKQGWDRLLTFGIGLTWVVFATWLIPYVVSPGAVAKGTTYEPVGLLNLLIPLGLTWAAFQAAVLWRHHNTEQRQTWLVSGYLINTAGGFGLMMFLVQAFDPTRTWMAAAAFGILYILGAWAFKAGQRRVLYLISGTVGLGALALVTPLRLGFESHWVPMSRMIGLEVLLAAGIFLRERYFRILAYLAFAYTFYIDLLVLKIEGATLMVAGMEVSLRVPLFALAAIIGFTNVYLLRKPWRKPLSEQEYPSIPRFFSASASLLFLLLLWLELPETLVAPAIVVAGLVGLAVTRLFALRDFAVEVAVYVLAAVIAVIVHNIDAGSTLEDLTWRATVLAVTTGLLYAGYAFGRWRTKTTEAEFRPWLTFAAVVFSVGAGLILTLLIFIDVPDVWVAPALMAWVALYFTLALRLDLPELLWQGLLLTVVGVIAIIAVAWGLDDRIFGLPERLVSVSLALAFAFVAEQLFERYLDKQDDREEESRGRFAALTAIYLVIPTLILCWLVKAEALAFDKNLLVALIWGVAAIVYLEIARGRSSKLWLAHGHAIMAAAIVHLFLVNFVQLGAVGPISLRLATVVPFLGFLLYVYNTWSGTTDNMVLDERLHKLRFVYLYAIVAVAATLLAYELWRAWVIVAWGVLAVSLLLRWRKRGNVHWRLCALGLGIAMVARGIGVNLYYRDEIADFKINLLTVPLAAAALLAGYVLVRLKELHALRAGDASADGQRLLDIVRRHRMAWLVSLVVLLTGFIWVEADGPIFTICLSLEGLGLIGLGIAMRERWARLSGLFTLGLCVIKLFVDLFSMEGVPGWVPFLLVGVVLLSVAFGYTRFKDRLKELL